MDIIKRNRLTFSARDCVSFILIRLFYLYTLIIVSFVCRVYWTSFTHLKVSYRQDMLYSSVRGPFNKSILWLRSILRPKFSIRSHRNRFTKLSYLIIILRSVIILRQPITCRKSSLNIVEPIFWFTTKGQVFFRVPTTFHNPLCSFCRLCNVKISLVLYF